MAHSYSSLKLMDQCPQQYKVVKLDKLYPFKQTPEVIFGNEAHEALENYLNHSTALPEKFKAYAWVTEQLIPALLPWRVAEVEFSWLRGGAPADHRDWRKKYWSGKADVMATDHPLQGDAGDPRPTQAQVIDWKSGGSRYPDTEQLELMALFSFYQVPTLQVVNGFLVFLQDAKVTPANFTRAQMSGLEAKWNHKAMEEEQRRASNDWPTKPGHLCPWCPHTVCEHWTAPRAKR
jgi:PD-(D/E)XK nuclease superfamily